MEAKEIQTFESAHGVTFADKRLLAQAFTHRSYINEHRELKLEHNERLEFLGDAVLELVVTDKLFRQFPDKAEGELTAIRAALVNTNSLSEISETLGFNNYLLLSKGEAKDTGRARQYILANTFEAVVGAMYLDQGYDAAKAFIEKHVLTQTDEIVNDKLWQDAKSTFQEEAQERLSMTPTYQTIKETGPDHDRSFLIGVYLGDEEVARGEGRSKQEAEQQAAARALQKKAWGEE